MAPRPGAACRLARRYVARTVHRRVCRHRLWPAYCRRLVATEDQGSTTDRGSKLIGARMQMRFASLRARHPLTSLHFIKKLIAAQAEDGTMWVCEPQAGVIQLRSSWN